MEKKFTFEVTIGDSLGFKHIIHVECSKSTDIYTLLEPAFRSLGILTIGIKQKVQ